MYSERRQPSLEDHARDRFLLALSDRIADLDEPQTILSLAAVMIERELEVSRAEYRLLGSDPASAEWRADDPDLFCEDIRAAPRRPRHLEARARDDARAVGVIPIARAGQPVARLVVAHQKPRIWTDFERRLLREVAERAWTAVERARSRAALRASEARYRTLFGAIDDGFCVLEAVHDPEGRLVDLVFREVNLAFERHTGLRDVVNRSLRATLPSLEPHWIEAYSKVLATGEPIRTRSYVQDLGRWYEVFLARVGDADSRFVAAVFVDITDRRRSEARRAYLLKLSDTLRPLADASTIQRDASRILREQLGAECVCYWEVAGEEVIAAEEDSPTGRPSFLGRRFRFADYGVSHEAFVGGVTSRDDVAGSELSDDQKASYASLHVGAWAVAPLVKDGVLLALLGCYFRTAHAWSTEELALLQETAERTWAATERARAEAALKQSVEHARELLQEATSARAQAESANRAKDEFLATLSHELRTPLAAILLWSGALKSGSVPINELGRAIDAIAQSAESQSRLIEDLLDLSRLAAGKLALSRSAVDVAEVVWSAVHMLQPMTEAKDLALDVEVADDLGFVFLDGTRLEQILGNLLTNATKFTPAGGSVSLRVRKVDSLLELEVTDTGQGIDPAFMPRLFEKFSQADMRETRQYAGLGIGLALTKQLVELHGGTIQAESPGTGLGATFRVRLPCIRLERAHAPDARLLDLPAASALSGVRVLLVEDDSNTRAGMQWLLERAGGRVTSVATAAEALDALDAANGADVVISDLGLPGVSGLELIQRIGQQYRSRGKRPPPSCAVSAHVRDVDRRRAIDAGFDMYLAKPVTAERLIEAVNDLRDILVYEAD